MLNLLYVLLQKVGPVGAGGVDTRFIQIRPLFSRRIFIVKHFIDNVLFTLFTGTESDNSRIKFISPSSPTSVLVHNMAASNMKIGGLQLIDQSARA